jgi:hypothetical protein
MTSTRVSAASCGTLEIDRLLDNVTGTARHTTMCRLPFDDPRIARGGAFACGDADSGGPGTEEDDMPSPQTLLNRLEAVERLASLFRVERFVYLAITAVSFLLLFGVAVRMFIQGTAQIAEWSLLFGSSGLITITANRVLQVWTQALRMVASEPVDGAPREANNG